MSNETWRDVAKRTIARVIQENPEADYKTFKKILRDSYPFGRREHFPYKVWCDQQKRTLKLLYPNGERKNPDEPNEGLFLPIPFELYPPGSDDVTDEDIKFACLTEEERNNLPAAEGLTEEEEKELPF